MRKLGLRAYILFNITLICAIGMFLIGIISTKITEQFAIQGRVEGTKSIIRAFESSYLKMGRTEEGIEFLKSALNQGASGVVLIEDTTYNFLDNQNTRIPNELKLYKTSKQPVISLEGSTFWPFATYKAYTIIHPLSLKPASKKGVVYVYQPLQFFEDTIRLSQKLTIMWTFLFVLIIIIFGFFLLSRTLVNPIEKLIQITKEIAKGKFSKDEDIDSNISEVNKLYDSLYSMYEEIEDKKNLLEKNIDQLEIANKELITAQKQLVASEKMASLGKLSAGVAHEIGNPMSSISGYTELLKSTTDDEKKKEYLEKITDESERINSIIKTLLDYARPKEKKLNISDLNEVIKKAVNILNSQGTLKSVDIKMDLCENKLNIKMDTNQMVQVFINLIINSVDALNGSGKIELKTKMKDGNFAQAEIMDNGEGIPEKNLDKIFDPFFTTKSPGKGTGLGLSICQRIIHEFDGKITVESEAGKGTRFEIIFTCVQN